jgi:shikimate dehydrogenase
MHNCVFKNLNYKACYTRVHLKDGSKLRDTFLSLKLSGANITVPHKEAAFNACDEIRGFANEVGVVNTIINENGKLIGYNTDADGFMYAIEEFKNIQNILVIGAGGTARALSSRFKQDNIEVDVLNRSEGRLKEFKDVVDNTYTWNNLEIKKYDLVVNTTSAGLSDENYPCPLNILENILDNTRYVADAIYGKLTPFLKLADSKGLTYKDGSDMLLGQGVLANELFVNYKLKKGEIEKQMRRSFSL